VNAAFLIVTSACLTGADPVPLLAPAPPEAAAPLDKAPGDKAPGDKPPEKLTVPPGPVGTHPGPVMAHPGPGCGSGCGGCDNHGCDRGSYFSRWRGWSHSSCNSCDSCGHTSFWDRFRSHGSGCCDSCGSGGLFGRFRRHDNGCGCGDCGNGAVMHPVPVHQAEPVKVMPKEGEPKKLPKEGEPKKLPEGKEAAAPPIPEPKAIDAGTKSPFELSRRFEKRVLHAADYSQLTGQLFYVHADGGLWVLRYAPLDTEDRNGGGVILARDRSMQSYREGDLVTVHGEVLQERACRYLGAPLYRTSSIQLVERGQQ
jgi:hypothetical protein